MPVNVETPIATSTANGVTTVFPYTFTVLQTGDLVVTSTDSLGVVTTYTYGVHYTLSGVGTSAGSVNFLVAPANSLIITRYRSSALSRATDYQQNGDLGSDTLDADFDRCWLVLQEIFNGSKTPPGSIRVPAGETVSALPPAAQRAGFLLGFDGAGAVSLIAAAAQSATALALSMLGNAGSTLMSYLQAGSNAVLRTVQARLRDTINVTDFATVQDAVAQAYSLGAVLFFPAGNYAVTGNIPHFHDVRKTGNATITRGADVFHVEPVYSDVNTLYADNGAGVDTNDGLTSALPMKTAARVASVLATYRLWGSWTSKFAAGTDTGLLTFPEGLTGFGTNRLTLQGPIVGDPNVPTFIVDGGGVQDYGWNFNSQNKLTLSDIKFSNFITFGWVAQDACDITDTNVHVTAVPNGPGKKMQGPGRWRSNGGISSFCQSGLAAIGNVVFTFSSIKSKNNTQAGVALQEGATGHIDNPTMDGNPIHVDAIVRARAHILGGTFTNAVTCHCRGQVLSDFYDSPTTPNSFDTSAPRFLMYSGSVLTASQAGWTSELMQPVDISFATLTGTVAATTIKTYATALAANQLTSSVKRMRIVIYGELTGTASTKNLTVNLGGSPWFGFTIPAAATGSYILEGELTGQTGASQSYRAKCLINQLISPATGSRSINLATGAAIPLTIVGQNGSAADTISVRGVELWNAGG